MLKAKPFANALFRFSVAPALLLGSTFAHAITDEEVAALEARIAQLEATSSWSAAATPEVNPLSIHGFVNAGISSANNDGAADLTGGIGDDLNYQAHQSFGLQVSYQISDQTDVVGQFLGRGYDDNFNVSMNWAYIGHTLLENKGPMTDLKLRMGRAPADIYMISEYYDVGYAYPWVVPPRVAYDLLGGLPYDGIDLAANFTLPADWNMQLKGYVGEVDEDPVAGNTSTRFDLDKVVGMNMLFERDAWRIRVGYGQASVNYQVCSTCQSVATGAALGDTQQADFDTLTTAINGAITQVAGIDALLTANLGPAYTSTYDSTTISDSSDNLPGSFSGAGVSFDNGTWLVMAEYVLQRWDTYNPDMDLAYITVGRRFGDWMPYLTAEQAKIEDDGDIQDILDNLDTVVGDEILATLDAAIAGGNAALVPLRAAVAAGAAGRDGLETAFNGLASPRKVYSVGVRYDFAPGATAKLQVDNLTDFEDRRGDLENTYVSHFSIQAAF